MGIRLTRGLIGLTGMILAVAGLISPMGFEKGFYVFVIGAFMILMAVVLKFVVE